MLKKTTLFIIGLYICTFAISTEAISFKPSSQLWYLSHSMKNDVKFILLGTTHMIGDTNNPQIKDIQDIFKLFKPDAVVLEGGIWEPKESTEAAINCCGEMGLAALLASKTGAEILTWDSTNDDDIAQLSLKYPASIVQLFFFLREIAPSYSRNMNKTEEEILTLAFERSKSSYDMGTSPNTVDEAENLLKVVYGQEYKLRDFKIFDNKIKDIRLKSLLSMKNEINVLRDKVGVEKVLKYSKKYKRILILLGKDHFRYFMSKLNK